MHFIDYGENAKPHDMCFRNKKDIMFFAASFVGARFCAELQAYKPEKVDLLPDFWTSSLS